MKTTPTVEKALTIIINTEYSAQVRLFPSKRAVHGLYALLLLSCIARTLLLYSSSVNLTFWPSASNVKSAKIVQSQDISSSLVEAGNETTALASTSIQNAAARLILVDEAEGHQGQAQNKAKKQHD